MSSKSEFAALDVMHRLGLAGEKVGLTKGDWAKLAEDPEAMRYLAAWRRGRAKIEMLPVVVDCSTPLRSINGLTPLPDSEQIASRYTGKLTLTPEAVALYLDPGQQGKGVIDGNELRKRLEGQQVLTAHVLDVCHAHPELIPESWNRKLIFFWGTIYSDPLGSLYVRCLYWHDGLWIWGSYWLGDDWHKHRWVAIHPS